MTSIPESYKDKKKRELKEKIVEFKGWIKWVVIGIIIVSAIIFSSRIYSVVEQGTYEIKQTAVRGKMYAKMDPGFWWELFADIEPWPKAETFFFTSDTKEGKAFNQSIEVRFVDGSLCDISGTLRIRMPLTKQMALSLVVDRGHQTYYDLEQKLILPTVRNVLRLTANLMTARESYAEMRTDFIFWADDQIQNGLYQTEDKAKKVKDLVSGKMVTKTFKVIRRDDNGVPLYQRNPLKGTGIILTNFEVKSFDYAPVVKTQIEEQQKAIMGIATAKANAQEAEQEKLTIEAQGAAKVAKAKYKELEIKVVKVVISQRNKEVAEIDAARDLAVAILQRKAAKETKQRDILLGQGLAEKKRLVMQADGALKQKLAVMQNIHKYYAEAYSKRLVPTVYMTGAGGGKNGTVGPDNEFTQFMKMMNIFVATQLAQDMSIEGLKK